jgi:hypothetical protein
VVFGLWFSVFAMVTTEFLRRDHRATTAIQGLRPKA